MCMVGGGWRDRGIDRSRGRDRDRDSGGQDRIEDLLLSCSSSTAVQLARSTAS